ncbi:integrase [Caballeronia sp. LZ008]|uniref:integrase n=1 Tax=unclassified Caballeronia TaxID=2646786 RepID=UPI002027D32C|nr:MULTISPECIES: integrase [unclassified Caballeronia]MDR5794520.1 integrase [Caballeronia sp. LZ008]
MTRTLLLHDRLAPPGNHDAYLEILDPKPRDGHVKVFDADKLEDRYVSVTTVLSDLDVGKLTLLRSGKPRFSHAAQPDDAALHERNRFLLDVMQRIKSIQKQRGLSFRQAYRLAEAAYNADAPPESPPFPPQSTMYRYRKHDLCGLPMLRGNKNKGNRVPRYPMEVVNTICTAAEQHFLVPMSRWSLVRLTDYVDHSVRGTYLPESHAPISARYVKRTIERFVTTDIEGGRMLPQDVGAAKSLAKKRIRAELPFERVEQDALHLPFVVLTPGGVSSTIYLVHAIDCCTGYPLGWRLVVGAPVDADTLACVEMYMSAMKVKRFEELAIDHAMNVCGTPGQLIFDNGPEAKGSRIQNLEKLGTDVKHCKSRNPQEKPFIERLNKSLKVALEGLGGCTRMDGVDGKRDPIALGDELMTLEQLERWIVRWYYEKWVHKPLERLQWDVVLEDFVAGDTPAERWKHFEASCFAISLPPSRSEWLATLYEHKPCRLSRKTGITIDGLHYKEDDISVLLEKYGEHQFLHVLFNPDDFRHIYIYEGDDFPVVTLPFEHLRPETPAWSFADAKEKLKKRKASFTPAPQAEKFDADMREQVVADSHSTRRKKPGKHERNRETTRREKEAKAVERAARHPVPQPPAPASKPRSALDLPSSAAQATGSMFDDVSPLPLLDRNSGDLLI